MLLRWGPAACGRCFAAQQRSIQHNIDSPPDDALVRRLAWASVVCGITGALLGATALLGWITGSEALKGGLVAGITMKTNAALGTMLTGLIILLLRGAKSAGSRLGRGAAWLLLIIGSATLVEHVAGLNLGIDQLLFEEPAGATATQSPNRMGPLASLCLTLLGLARLVLDVRTVKGRAPFQSLVMAVLLLTSVPLLGYILGAQQLFSIGKYTAIALPAALALWLLAAGFLLARPDVGFMRRLVDNDSGALLIRRLLPAAVFMPIVLMLLRILGEEVGLYGQTVGRALLVLSVIVAFTVIIWRTGEVVFRQATSAARAERELRERLVHSLESMNDAFFACDADYRLTYINAAAERTHGLAREDIIGRTLWEVFSGSLGDDAKRAYRRAMVERVAVKLETVDADKGRQLEHEIFPTPDGGLCAYGRDVTQQRRAVAVLREREALFRTLGEAVPDFLWMSDRNGVPVYQNPAWARYTGSSQITFGAVGWDTLVHRDDLEMVKERWLDATLNGAPFHVDARIRRHDGAHRWFSLRVVPATDDTHGPVHWIGTGTDIDQRKKTEDALADADRRKTEFLAVLAHELRNPLAPVRNAVHLLRARDSVDAEAARIYSIIERQIAHLARLIDDLMDVSRISQDKLELRKSHAILSEIIDGAVEGSRYVIDAHRHQISIKLPEHAVHLEADTVRLVQVFTNLLTNAARYTPPGGKLSVSAAVEGEQVVVSVSDTGVGLDAQQSPRIFEMFVQAENPRRQQGLGIGLALVKKLVELHAGSVSAYSPGPGQGSTFRVLLPLAAARPSLEPSPRSTGLALPALTGLSVLVVEDNEDSAEMLSTLLETTGADVHTAHDGETALVLSEEFHPQIVLLDIGLPRMSGYDVARELRRTRFGAQTSIVALTGWGHVDDRARSREAGFDHHMVKPVDPQALLSLIAEVRRSTPAAGYKSRHVGRPDRA